MRTEIVGENVRVGAIAGTSAVLLKFDLDEKRRDGLPGFAIWCQGRNQRHGETPSARDPHRGRSGANPARKRYGTATGSGNLPISEGPHCEARNEMTFCEIAALKPRRFQ
jgi:hypothetical protein